ncbi:hypothetical protein K402DRAFT_390983 [Aulographum hederae CBS 113979]|uniref:Uncharacterized protein n=1 Tax=Aulographum hederae CBS 113979 TaxID=1176131 RepID=A0A6G1H860_9PEZI|nr:hypothetical protein K402DRAFT_390983 [Aulographum hederae CBS 113979]
MRNAIIFPILSSVLLLLATSPTTATFADLLSPFYQALDGSSTSNTTSPTHDDLRKRQSDNCADGYTSCSPLGAAGAALCCNENSLCAIDYGGHVACCPIGAVCTGSIGVVSTTATTTATDGGAGAGGVVVPGQTTVSTTTTTQSFVFASSTDSQAGTEATQGVGTINDNGTPVAVLPTAPASGAGRVRGGVCGFLWPLWL